MQVFVRNCTVVKICRAPKKAEFYLDNTHNTLVIFWVRLDFVVSLLIPFDEKVFGVPFRSIWGIFVLYGNPQNIVCGVQLHHLTLVLNIQQDFTFSTIHFF